jgi:hypothetical protein
MELPLLAASEWGLAIAIFGVLVCFIGATWFIVQATRQQLFWRQRAAEGDVDAIRMMVEDEVARWKTMKMPKGETPSTWHGIQTAELLEVSPGGVRISAIAEGQYAVVAGERREVNNSYREALSLTAKLADMLMYDVPNVRLNDARIDIFSTFRDDQAASQRCIMTTSCSRDVAAGLDWDGMDPEEIVRAFNGRYLLDDRGNAMPIEVDAVRESVPAVFYEDDD